ncbi:MAG TPA: GntR family transcriptional regulator [Stellaceae bacterium]|jgi:DNA-binding GntR family transcriptional regulator|nr:GntR family transcriptional regulator [Stellaceae bacterium]
MTPGSSPATRRPLRERHLLGKTKKPLTPSAFTSEDAANEVQSRSRTGAGDEVPELHAGADVSAVEAAYRHIKQRIIAFFYPPGTKLSEVRLAREIGLGRSPIRSALARLKGEGWVAVSPQSGTYVRPPNSTEIEELIELRLVLEIHAASVAAQRMASLELKRLRHSFDALGDHIDEAGLDSFHEVDTQIHGTIYRAAGNSLMSGILLNLHERINWIRRAVVAPLARIRESQLELGDLLDALEARDPERAAGAMRAHIGNFDRSRKSRIDDRE